jgi:UDP-3-O-[3-hydroxymyristoyl] N-acetylglucosamine deacetylase
MGIAVNALWKTMSYDFYSSPYGYRVQKTLNAPLSFRGIGLHTGAPSQIRLLPAPPSHGIIFERVDLKRSVKIPAHYDAVVDTAMATSLGVEGWPEARVGTVEHLMAALYAMGISNVLVEVNGPEIPILDGSAGPFLDRIWEVGLEIQPFSNPTLKVTKPIKIYQNGAICELLPRERLRLTTSIDFPHPAIGLQTFALELTPKAFRDEVCEARTFGFLKDVEKLKRAKLAQGASLDNVLAFSETEVLNPGGARFSDECVRHKLLDAMGDLALCGCWIMGELVSFRGGHSIHLALLKSLKEQRSHWEILPIEPLPGISLAEPTLHAPVEAPRAYLS